MALQIFFNILDLTRARNKEFRGKNFDLNWIGIREMSIGLVLSDVTVISREIIHTLSLIVCDLDPRKT
jgi:hypothetical protein